MINEMLIISRGKNRRVIVYPTKGSLESRKYDEPTESSCERLEEMIRKYDTRIYLRKQRVGIWIAR